ncbi:YTH domain-containing protein ECT4 [Vicia villosa]|uniref:YTH domain-containing protein ECT4 n=1 Tax=Vicia villosa TaxID=3911 RepID=UPI00273C4341|nr:YTH domain-containing protein ECT4 [Vicia villosa]
MASTNGGSGSPPQVSDSAVEGTVVGVDGDYADQQPDLSYTSYFQQPGVHKSEAMPYRSSASPSVGMRYKPVSGSVFAKNYPKSSTLENQNSSQYAHRTGSLTSRLPKILTDRKEMEIQKKAPHLHSNFTAAAPPRTYNQTGNFSSFANPRSHVFPHTNYRPNSSTNYRPGASTNYRPNASTNYRPNASTTNYRPNASTDYRPNASTNYRPNGRVSNLNDRVLLSEEFRSGVPEMSKEVTRGPRFHQKSSQPQSSVVKDEFAITVCRDRYNLPDFQTKYESAKFYMIKSFNEDDIHKGIKHDVWTSTPHGNKKLNAAFQNAEAKFSEAGTQCPVFLFFSVNASGQFVGVAEMLGPVDFKKDMKFWKLDKYNGFFPIKWHIIKDVPNRQFVHIILQNNENKCVTFSRDTQEIGLKEGLEMLKIFKSYQAKTCLLDDFDFYENREKLIHSQKITKHTGPKQEVYHNDSYYNTMKAREEKIEMHSSGSNQESLVKLTKNLSLNPSVRQGFR